MAVNQWHNTAIKGKLRHKLGLSFVNQYRLLSYRDDTPQRNGALGVTLALSTTVRLDFVTASLNKPQIMKYSRNPLIRKMVIRIANYPERLGLSGKFVENNTKLTCLEIPAMGSSTVQCYGL